MIRIGIIGAGPNGAGHARYYAGCEQAELVAIADPAEDRRGPLAEELDCDGVNDFKEMLDRVDAVVISSPNFLHHDHAIACAQAGKHVFCEKPMGLSQTEAQNIADAINNAGVQSMVGFIVRHKPPIRTMAQLIRDGKIGEITSIWSRRLGGAKSYREHHWRGDATLSGGLLLEINVHEIDWMMQLVGADVKSVYAVMRSDADNHPRANDHIWITLCFQGGPVGVHEGSWSAATPDMFIGLHGTEGGAQTDQWRTEVRYHAMGQKEPSLIEKLPESDFRAEFLESIRTGRPTSCDVNWGLKVMNVAEAAYQSAGTGQAINL